MKFYASVGISKVSSMHPSVMVLVKVELITGVNVKEFGNVALR